LSYTILGAWDSDLSQGIISYQTPVARALLNHVVGDTIDLMTDEGKTRQVSIQKIEPHQIDLTVPA
jgi:transcription elongation GreA/GreB family factor